MQDKRTINSEILHQRALSIAEKRVRETIENDTLTLLEFEVEDHCYAIPAKNVSEIFKFKDVHPVFGAPQWIKGILTHRGHLYSVFCLSAKAGGQSPGDPSNGTILLIEFDGQSIALFSTTSGRINHIRDDAIRTDKRVISDHMKQVIIGIYGEEQRAMLDVQSLMKLASSL